MLGNAKLNKLDVSADLYLKKFLSENKGRSYQKEANRKLAWFYLINDRPDLYKKYMQQVLEIKDAPTDEDKSAQREAEQHILPNKSLLKARVLTDGGYPNKALEIINAINLNNLISKRDQIEYYYRKARILQELQLNSEAIRFYLLTIQKGEKYNYYFAANACNKLAYLLEVQQKRDNAIRYYTKAIGLEKDEYQNSINAEAKAGLNRLGK
jgi:tetratricopeptide (TPR) repeat protein